MRVFLETERLVLRRFTEADVDNLVELDGDPEVMRYLTGGGTTPRAEIERDILPRFLGYYERHDGFGFWAALERASGDFLNRSASENHILRNGIAQSAEADFVARRPLAGISIPVPRSAMCFSPGLRFRVVQPPAARGIGPRRGRDRLPAAPRGLGPRLRHRGGAGADPQGLHRAGGATRDRQHLRAQSRLAPGDGEGGADAGAGLSPHPGGPRGRGHVPQHFPGGLGWGRCRVCAEQGRLGAAGDGRRAGRIGDGFFAGAQLDRGELVLQLHFAVRAFA